MRKVNELTTEEYIDCVIASEKKNFKKWCENHDVDYEDAMSYDWDQKRKRSTSSFFFFPTKIEHPFWSRIAGWVGGIKIILPDFCSFVNR